MKKWVLYSLGFTFATVFIGLLFIYGVFDFSSGKSALIGPVKHIDDQEYHDATVEYLHDLGNNSQDVLLAYYSLNEGDILDNFYEKIETLNFEKQKFADYMNTIKLPSDKQLIITTFETNYLPILNNFAESFQNFPAFFEENPVTKENLESFRILIEVSYTDFIAAHNSFTEVLNENRKY